MSAGNKVSKFVLLPELILEKSYYVAGVYDILRSETALGGSSSQLTSNFIAA